MSKVRNVRNGKHPRYNDVPGDVIRVPASLPAAKSESKGSSHIDCEEHSGSNFDCDVREITIVWINSYYLT